MTNALRDAIVAARQRAAKTGPMHALWDVIFDAEAWATGRETLSQWGSGEAAEQKLIAALTR